MFARRAQALSTSEPALAALACAGTLLLCVLASSKHAALAQRFVTFAVSKAGQHTLETGGDFEYPLATGVPAAPKLTPLSRLAPPAIRVADLGGGKAALKLLQEVGLL